MNERQISWVRKHKTITILGVISLLVLGLLNITGIRLLFNHAQDLGSNLEYVGKEDAGCMPIPFSFYCDVAPISVYYFATDMNQEELTQYFKYAKYDKGERQGYPLVEKDSSRTEMRFKKGTALDAGFSVDYYDNPEAITRKAGLRKTHKKYLISLDDFSYQVAASSL